MCRASGRRDKCAGWESDHFPPGIFGFNIFFYIFWFLKLKLFIISLPQEEPSTDQIHISWGGSPRGFSLYSKTPRMLGCPLEMWREAPVMSLLLVRSDGQYLRSVQLTFSVFFISRSLLRRLCSGSLLFPSRSSVSSMSSSITLLYLRLLFPRPGSSWLDGWERFLILSLLLGFSWSPGARTMSMWGSLRSVVMAGLEFLLILSSPSTHQSPRAEHCVVRRLNINTGPVQCVVRGPGGPWCGCSTIVHTIQ